MSRRGSARKPSCRSGPCWVVFARRRYDEALLRSRHGNRSMTLEMAVLFAQSLDDEHPWIEMLVAPRHAMRTVIAS